MQTVPSKNSPKSVLGESDGIIAAIRRLAQSPEELIQRITESIKVFRPQSDKDECWEWCGRKDTNGYGRIHIINRSVLVHRLVWEIEKGVIPVGLCICHKCDNPPCSNPNHLFLGTQQENVIDCIQKGRGNRAFGEKITTSKLTQSAVAQIKESLASGEETKKVARDFGVSRITIANIRKGKVWKHVLPELDLNSSFDSKALMRKKLSKLTPETVSEIRERLDSGEPVVSILQRFPTSKTAIYKIGRGESWRNPV
jgi:hypothetical protein